MRQGVTQILAKQSGAIKTQKMPIAFGWRNSGTPELKLKSQHISVCPSTAPMLAATGH